MPDWRKLLDEISRIQQQAPQAFDQVRRKYLAELHQVTGRNTIIYYSGWLQRPEDAAKASWDFSIHDSDKTGFMMAVHELDRELGLDLILHTPGGAIAATESLVDYLRSLFGANIRAIIPQLAMSAGTMIALACPEIVMGKQSSLGPIDPQFNNLPAHGIIEEFNRAAADIAANPQSALVWQPIIAKYSPTLIGECQKAIRWSTEITKEWLKSGMFLGREDAAAQIEHIVAQLGQPALTQNTHDRHISAQAAGAMGLNVVPLEENQRLQDAVLSVHHACIHTLTATAAVKIIENHLGRAYVRVRQPVAVPQ